MELAKHKSRLSKEFGVKKSSQCDFTDVTILSTPLPQATSTVDGKSMAQSKGRRSNLSEQHNSKHRQLNFESNNVSLQSESSLGIIDNISALLENTNVSEFSKKGMKNCPEQERELARKTIQKCDGYEELSFTSLRSDKENNVNSSNLMETSNVISYPANKKKFSNHDKNHNHNSPEQDNKSVSTASLLFEPKEISARSSELSKSLEQSFGGISYNSNLDAIKEQFNDEDFMSGSKIDDRILADEISWRKDNLIETKSNKENLEFSCFSTAVAGSEIVENGLRVSAGEFFQRKCGNLGHLSTTSSSDRPSFGIDIRSPNRKGKLRPLVNDSLATEESSPGEKEIKSADCTKDPSVMSLSTIAQVLHNLDSETPKKLVDQLLDANKKKKRQHQKHKKNDPASETYTLVPSSRASLPVSTTLTLSEKDSSMRSLNKRLSLDDDLDSKSFDELLNQVNLHPKLDKLLDSNVTSSLSAEQLESKTEDFFPDSLHLKAPNASIPRPDATTSFRRQLSKLSLTQNNTDSVRNQSSLIFERRQSSGSDPTLTKNDSSLKETTMVNSPARNRSFDIGQVVISKKTPELCVCLVGIPREADFEIYNGSVRWILCKIKLNQIQGERDHIQLDLPPGEILVEPDAHKLLKVGVMMPQMGKLTIANLSVPCCDMVTRNSWEIKHFMCFVPEEPNVKLSWPSNDGFINFETITEDSSCSLPITINNKNSIDIPILLYIHQNEPELFSIGECPDDTLGNQKGSASVLLKSKQPLTINLDFKGISFQSLGEKALSKGIFNAQASLRLYVCFKENEEYLLHEVPLKGVIGSCKLDILDTQFPLSLQPRVEKRICVKNSGRIAVSATVEVVQSKESHTECRDFFICPNIISLNGNDKLVLQIVYKPENNKTDCDRHAMIKLVVGNKISFYPVIGEKSFETEHNKSGDSYHQIQRCETPQNLRHLSSPTSMHSLIHNRSGNSGRNSPGSTASGGTAAPGNCIPIRATHTSLVWGSVKVGKSDVKQFTILNTSNSKIKLIALIKTESQNFKFVKDRQNLTNSMIVTLQGTESKALHVVFAPNSAKAAAGKVVFTFYNCIKDGRQLAGPAKVVQLYGYGGYGKVEITEAVKDTSGQMWLSFGKMNAEGVLHAKLKLHNKGDLKCFSKIKLTPKALYPSVLSNWSVEPNELLLSPNEAREIFLEFRPTKDDFAALRQSDIIHVGTIKLIHGDEATRLRIRRLHNKLKDRGQFYPNTDEEGNECQEIINQISRAFPGETFMQDLKLIGDSVQNLNDLCKGIIQNEIKLTVEFHPDETISTLQDDMNESNAYYSLCSDHENTSHFGGESYLPAD